MRKTTIALLAAIAAVTACGKNEPAPAPQPQEQVQEAAQPAPQPEPAAPEAAAQQQPSSLVEPMVPPPASAPAIQTMQAANGMTFNLTKLNPVGQILVVEIMVLNPKNANGKNVATDSITLKFKDIYYIDDASAQKVTLLKDDNGRYMASPNDGNNMYLSRYKEAIKITLRFPRPPENSTSISINLDEAGSFDAVPLQR